MEKAQYLFLTTIIAFGLQSCATSNSSEVSQERSKQSQQQLAQALDYLRNQQLPEAKLAVSDSLKSNPGNAQAHHIAALVAQRSGQSAQAREHFKTAIELAPTAATILNNYGNFLCATGNYAAAERNFTLAAAQPDNTQPAIAHTNTGLCALRSNKSEQAKASFERAIQLDPTQTTALYQLARLNLEAGKPLSASTLMEQYSQHGQDTAKTLLLLARIEQALGNYENMEQYKQRLQAEFPNSVEVGEAKTLAASGTGNTPAGTATTTPKAQNLSDADWLLSREPGHYTLQILATEDQAAIQNLLASTPLQSATRQYSFKSNDKTWFNLVMGDYADLNSARRELQSLPDSLQQLKPWIRRFDSIQRVISQKGL